RQFRSRLLTAAGTGHAGEDPGMVATRADETAWCGHEVLAGIGEERNLGPATADGTTPPLRGIPWLETGSPAQRLQYRSGRRPGQVARDRVLLVVAKPRGDELRPIALTPPVERGLRERRGAVSHATVHDP